MSDLHDGLIPCPVLIHDDFYCFLCLSGNISILDRHSYQAKFQKFGPVTLNTWPKVENQPLFRSPLHKLDNSGRISKNIKGINDEDILQSYFINNCQEPQRLLNANLFNQKRIPLISSYFKFEG